MISVLGQGAAGLCAATALAEAGFAVEVIGGGPAPVSGLAGGMLAPFCEGEAAPEIVVARGAQAVDWWADRVPGVLRRGTLVVAPQRDAAELDRFAGMTRTHGWVDPGELEPDLAGRFSRGLFFAGEAHLDPLAALDALRAALVARGVACHDGAPRGRIVDCRGMGAPLPGLRPVRGEKIDLHAPDFRLGGGTVPYAGEDLVPAGAFRYLGPCPPAGPHRYMWTAKARDRGTTFGRTLGEATATRSFPD